jgi:hypothetical protein
MRRKRLLVGAGIGVGLFLGIMLMLGLMVKHEPSFYHRVGLGPGSTRHQNSVAFVNEVVNRVNRLTGEPKWQMIVTEAQINSFFEEDFIRLGLAEKLLPANLSGPRLSLEGDQRVRLGFRYGEGLFSTILSAEFKVWMAAKEPNVVVLELIGMQAGALPIAPQPFLEQLSEVVRGPNIDVTWYRHNGHPTAAIQFRGEQARPSVVLRHINVRPCVLTIVGRSLEPSAPVVNGAPPRQVSAPAGN